MSSNGSDKDAKKWRCPQCKYNYKQLLREPQPRGNKPGVLKHGPGKRRSDDPKGKRLDTLTGTLEAIVEAPLRSEEQAEAIAVGAEVLAEFRENPI